MSKKHKKRLCMLSLVNSVSKLEIETSFIEIVLGMGFFFFAKKNDMR